VFVTALSAAALDTNCYVVASAGGEECVVIDPGVGLADRVQEHLAESRLRPVAVLLTHGHFDHVFSAPEICERNGIPVWVHGADRYRLEDPLADLDPQMRAALTESFDLAGRWSVPRTVVEFTDGEELGPAGLRVTVVHAPGHTEGSVLLQVEGAPEGIPAGSTVFTGDVLFAGSVGRTDLAGGDPVAMTRTLRERIGSLSGDALVLPGHGLGSTVARERASNPFLAELV
jgi:hydroxyacylglutathione hydrolase